MRLWTRRRWLAGLGLGAAILQRPPVFAATGRRVPPVQERPPAVNTPLDLTAFEPRSMLHVKTTRVERARFPVIDIHTHLGLWAKWAGLIGLSDDVTFLGSADDVLAMMDRKNVRLAVNLTGAYGKGLAESVGRFDRAHPGRFLTFAEPAWHRVAEPGYAAFQGEEIVRARRAGAAGLKVLKVLGLYLREQITAGPLIKVDDPRFDPMFESCAALQMPVAIHIADPEAFFLPVDRFNERFEELNRRPDYSFYGHDFPSFREMVDAFYRVVARHPRTTFIAVHVGHNAENLQSVSEYLDRHKNVHIDIAARIAELGRQPRTARRFFDRYQDRILFGTDHQVVAAEERYEIYFRFLETEDEYFNPSTMRVPSQGRWMISGLGLPDGILRKVYHDNAARLLGIKSL